MTNADAPAVTFALFAYNQEDYVREAIEGAFAQRFSALEILLSDDGSTDNTFGIMEEMAAAYRGPHQVRVRREPSNAGTVQHVINVARAARGDLMVVAAGDDISYPDRTQILHDAWKAGGAAALASRHDEIDAACKILRKNVSFPSSAVTQWLFANEVQAHRIDGIIQTLPGFCAAYPRSFWADLPDPPVRLLVEDGLAGALIILRGGRIERVPQSLIAYRLLDTSMTDRGSGQTAAEIRLRESRSDRNARESLGQIEFIIDQARREGIVIHPATLAAFEKGRGQNALIAGFWQASLIARIGRLFRARSATDVKFLLPRLFGLGPFAVLRTWARNRKSGSD